MRMIEKNYIEADYLPSRFAQLSIIQMKFMPLLISLQPQSTQLNIIHPHFMPLFVSLQPQSTQLSIIQPHFMLLFLPQEISGLLTNRYL
jgi:hypothetical protein